MKYAPLLEDRTARDRDFELVMPAESSLGDESGLVDMKQLEYLEQAIGRESFLEVVSLYIVEARSSMVDILDAYESGAFARIASKSHSGKSGAATLGCESLADTFEEIEVLAKQEDPSVDEMDQQIVRLQALLDVSIGTLLQHYEPLQRIETALQNQE